MEGPLVLVVGETSSLAESIQLLLETGGFGVAPQTGRAPARARLTSAREEPIRAIVIACNRPDSELLRGYPDSLPAEARHLPLLVVGGRAADSRRSWPSNVRFLALPLETDGLVEQLRRMTAGYGAAPGVSVPSAG